MPCKPTYRHLQVYLALAHSHCPLRDNLLGACPGSSRIVHDALNVQMPIFRAILMQIISHRLLSISVSHPIMSNRRTIGPPSLPPGGARSFRRLKRHCFQGRRRRENQLRPLEQPTDGGGKEGFERVACAVRCRTRAVPTYSSSSSILWQRT